MRRRRSLLSKARRARHWLRFPVRQGSARRRTSTERRNAQACYHLRCGGRDSLRTRQPFEEDRRRSDARHQTEPWASAANALRPDGKRDLVDGVLADWGMSIRRACHILQLDTLSYHCQSRRADLAFLKKRIEETSETHVRYCYRRVY
jgi:hypothetical protein